MVERGGGAGHEGEVEVGAGVRLWYRSVGEGPSTVLVPTCGNADDLGSLVRPGRRAVFYDVRNRGRSTAVADRRRLGFAAEVDDVGVVREALGLGRCSLLGWSYHAGVVVQHALRHPGTVDRLVLAAAVAPHSGTATLPGHEPPAEELAVLADLRAEGLPAADPARWCAAWRAVYVPLLMGDPTAFGRMVDVCALPNEWPQHVAEAMVHVFAELVDYDWRPALADLAVPTLVLHGSADREPVDSAFAWGSSLPDAQVLVVDGAGQLPWVEQPGPVFDAVDRFLAGPTDRGPG